MVARRGDGSIPASLLHATEVFALEACERDIVALLLANTTAPVVERRSLRVIDVVDQLAGIHDRVTLLGAFSEASPLSTFALIDVCGTGPRIERAVHLSDDLWPRLLGLPATTETRVAISHAQLALGAAMQQRVGSLAAWLATSRGAWPTVVVHGPPGAGRTAIAEALVAGMGCRVLPVDGARLTSTTIAFWRREIAWHQAIPVISDADHADPLALATFARLAACPLFVTARQTIVERVMMPGRTTAVIEVDPLTSVDRAAIWKAAFATRQVDAHSLDFAELGARFRFSPARIATVVSALVAGGATPTHDMTVALCRSIPEIRAGGLASLISSRRQWSDLVIPAHVRGELELILTWGRRRAELFDRGGIGVNARAPRGLTCLFHGPPGTGKTLAAQVIANELGRELYRVDLSQVVDKYIGETEKRLDTVFREAEAAGVILLFDEADALFAQRTSVKTSHDRYANLETGYLLQRIEDHDGIVILASNLENNLDPAFQRRLGVIVEMAAPAPPERQQIWELLLPTPALRDPDIDVPLLARSAPLAGGDIRNAVVAGILIAEQRGERLAMRHLAIAIWREIKRAGRLHAPGELAPWQSDVAAYAAVARR